MLNIILIILIILLLIISILSFMQKGPLISELYLFLNKKERQEMKTKDWYYYIGTIFLIMSIILGSILLEEAISSPFIKIFRIILIIFICIYSIVRYYQLESKRMENKREHK